MSRDTTIYYWYLSRLQRRGESTVLALVVKLGDLDKCKAQRKEPGHTGLPIHLGKSMVSQ